MMCPLLPATTTRDDTAQPRPGWRTTLPSCELMKPRHVWPCSSPRPARRPLALRRTGSCSLSIAATATSRSRWAAACERCLQRHAPRLGTAHMAVLNPPPPRVAERILYAPHPIATHPVVKLTRLRSPTVTHGRSHDDAFVVSGSEDGSVHMWDLVDPKRTVQLNGHRSPVVSVSCHPKRLELLTASHDGTAKIWKPKAS